MSTSSARERSRERERERETYDLENTMTVLRAIRSETFWEAIARRMRRVARLTWTWAW